MANSKAALPLDMCLQDWANAKIFEKEKVGELFALKREFWFLPGHCSGGDNRYPSTVIQAYIKRNHNVIVGDSEDAENVLEEFRASVDSGYSHDDNDEEDDEVFMSAGEETVNESRLIEILDEKETTFLDEMRSMERRLSQRMSSVRSSMEENLAEVERSMRRELYDGRTHKEYSIVVDSGAPLTVSGSDFMEDVVAQYRQTDQVIKDQLEALAKDIRVIMGKLSVTTTRAKLAKIETN